MKPRGSNQIRASMVNRAGLVHAYMRLSCLNLNCGIAVTFTSIVTTVPKHAAVCWAPVV